MPTTPSNASLRHTPHETVDSLKPDLNTSKGVRKASPCLPVASPPHGNEYIPSLPSSPRCNRVLSSRTLEGAMDDGQILVIESNISRFRKLLKDPLPDQMRKTIEGLLGEVELELVLETSATIC